MTRSTSLVVSTVLGCALAAYALVQGGRVDRDELERLVELLRVEPGAVVADVGAGDEFGSRVALAQCAPGLDPNILTNDFRVRMTYASTVVRYTPMPAP